MGVHVRYVPLREAGWRWLAERAKPIRCEDTTGFIALRGSEIVAAVAFDSWTQNSCLAHIAIEDPFVLRHGLLELAFNFVFLHAGRGIVFGMTPANNKTALRFNRKIGFQELYRLKDGYRTGIDYVLQEMRRESCRWIKPACRQAAAV